MTVIIIFILICMSACFYEVYECKSLHIVAYKIKSKKITGSIRIALFADIHGYQINSGNTALSRRIHEEAPDLILIPGDLVTRRRAHTLEVAEELLKGLSDIPVYASPGNHDSALLKGKQASLFIDMLNRTGTHFLNNETEVTEIRGQKIRISGLSLSEKFYERTGSPIPTQQDLEEALGDLKSNSDDYVILLAHTPAGHEAYLQCGADLTVSGHYHGGVVRAGNVGLITPQLRFFTKFAHGNFEKNGHHLIVTSGLGVHAIPFRVFNKPEVVMIDIVPEQES